MQFNEEVKNALGSVDFTHDPDAVARAVRSMPTRGLTALHDAIDATIAWAERSERLKKVVVLVSDGGDNASAVSFEDVLRHAQQANVSFFAVSLNDPTNADADPKKRRRLARETGGLVFTPAGERQVNEAFERIAADLQTGYTLAYVSNNTLAAPSGYHAVRVAARAPNGERLAIRTRAGYIPSGGPHAEVP
jgi:Ca-activated chloride channel homolog